MGVSPNSNELSVNIVAPSKRVLSKVVKHPGLF
jgi:hypothetical protein